MISGRGFFIWKLASMPSPDQLADLLAKYKTGWVAIKMLDGTTYYNQKGGNDKEMKEYIAAIRARGIRVGGWSYVYPEKPGPQGAYAGERIEKFTLDFYIADVEGEWKKLGLGSQAELYCNSVSRNKRTPLLFSSYRFPSLHPPLNFNKWTRNTEGDAPQVYWLGSHNPGDQMQKSHDEYSALREGEDFLFVPIGAAFGWKDWLPTKEDFEEFEAQRKALQCPAWGYWSLDWILAKNKYDWLEWMSGISDPTPPEDEVTKVLQVTNRLGLNLRTYAGTNYPIMGWVRTGAQLSALEVLDVGNDRWVKVGYGVWVAQKYRGKEYAKFI